MTDIWRPVHGFPNYYVSMHGAVVSSRKGIVLTQRKTQQGYRSVRLYRDGERHDKYVHQVVLESFRGECLPGQETLHSDDNPANNWLGNIDWGTRSQNQRDRVARGRHNNAVKTSCPFGHEYTLENTCMSQGGRKCRQCFRDRARKQYRAKKEQHR